MPAVSIYVKPFGHLPELMGLSRSLVTPHPMGRPLGPPGDAVRQRQVVGRALSLLSSNEPVVEEMRGRYSPESNGSA